jgi:RNA polymerase primary sigma factor
MIVKRRASVKASTFLAGLFQTGGGDRKSVSPFQPPIDQPHSRDSVSETSIQIRELLDTFDGESSLKRLFWELLSYERVREQLPLSLMPASVLEFMTALEVFATTDAFTIVIASVKFVADGGRLEQMIWAIKRQIVNCIVLLHEPSSWLIVYPDEILKPRVRILPLPGPVARRQEIVQALASLNAADETSGQELSALDLARSLDESFPGATPNIGEVLSDFERIAQHPDAEMRELLFLIRQAGQYPLLTPAQERGDDLVGDEQPPDGTDLPYHQWRLVIHNLRLVVWIARQWRGRGLELPDLVQEGTIGLMTAAKRYDPNRGNRFTTYAYWWVLQGVTRALFNGCNLFRWPVYKAPELLKAARDDRHDGLTAGEQRPVQLRSLHGLPCFGDGNPFDSTLAAETSTMVREVLTRLKPSQEQVINRRFGLGVNEEETLERIGEDFGLTRERVRQIEAEALRRLRKPYIADSLKPYYDSLQWRLHHSPEQLKPYDSDHLYGISENETIVPVQKQ